MTLRVLALCCAILVLAGCGSFFESSTASPQTYVLRLPSRSAPGAAVANPGSLRVQRPEAGPGLESENIALLRSDRRFDFYAATRWAAPAPDIVESLIVDDLRAAGMFSSVHDDASAYAPNYNLHCALSRFEADYTSGGGAPTVHVVLDCTLGRHRDRVMLASFTARGSAVASADRLNAVVAAFEVAAAGALAELEQQAAAALAAEPSRASAG